MVSLPIPLPSHFISVVTPGTAIKIGQVIAQKPQTTEERINLADTFGESVETVRKYLKKNPGDVIVPGDIVAQKSQLFGKPKKVVSRVNGTVLRFERDSACVVIQPEVGEVGGSPVGELVSPLDGTVSICNNEQIVIDVTGTVFAGKKGSGSRAEALVHILEPAPQQKGIADQDIVLLEQIHPGCQGKIIIGTAFSRDILMKAVVLSVAGIIGTHIADEDMTYLLEKNVTIPVLEIDQELYKKLFKYHGKKILIDGSVGAIIPTV